MGKRTNRQIRDDVFVGLSEFDGHLYPAKLEEAFEEAMRAALAAGNREDDVFDISIRVALREENQNVKTYSVSATKTGESIDGT
jgi:hypothetical protein